MRTTSSSSKLSKTIYQTSSNILQTHISMSKTYPILSNRMHAYVQSQKLIESLNQTSLNILKQVHTRTHSQYAKRLVSFSIRLEEPDKIVIGLPFTIPSTWVKQTQTNACARYRIEFSRSHVSLDRRRRRRADNCRCLDNKSVSIINRRWEAEINQFG